MQTKAFFHDSVKSEVILFQLRLQAIVRVPDSGQKMSVIRESNDLFLVLRQLAIINRVEDCRVGIALVVVIVGILMALICASTAYSDR